MLKKSKYKLFVLITPKIRDFRKVFAYLRTKLPKMNSIEVGAWKQCKTSVFWGEIAPCDHVVQIYEDDAMFINALEGFVISGLKDKESVIIIATEMHLEALKEKLEEHGFNIKNLLSDDQLILLNAKETLSKFMVNNWPDKALLTTLMSGVMARSRGNNRKVRAFGEMVAILYEQGHIEATAHLEDIWNEFMHTDAFSLFCAYPKSNFTDDSKTPINNICKKHTKMIAGWKAPINNILYKRVS